MTLQLVFDTKTERAVQRINKLQTNVRDITPVWHQVEADFIGQNNTTFTTNGRGTWPALTPKYARAKARRYPGAPTLYRTGALRASLTSRLDVDEIRPLSIHIGSLSDIGNYHRKGAMRRRGGLLRRRRPVILPKSWQSRQRSRVRHFIINGTTGP